MQNQIFENCPLVFLQLPNERLLLPWTTHKLGTKLEGEYINLENGRYIPTAKNVILDSGIASAYDYFCFYGKKSVSKSILSQFFGRLTQMTEKEKHKLTNAQIWGFIGKLREEEKMYTEKTRKIPPDKFAELDARNREKLHRALQNNS